MVSTYHLNAYLDEHMCDVAFGDYIEFMCRHKLPLVLKIMNRINFV